MSEGRSWKPAPRPDLYVVVRLLEALARHSNQLSRSALQRDAGLNYTLFLRYLEFLVFRGLVSIRAVGESEVIELTAKGYEAYRFLVHGLAEILGNELGGMPDPR